MRLQLVITPWWIGLLPMQALALGIRIPDQDPYATARGNAFVATADNPSAIYYNPAGITQFQGHNIRAGVYAISLNSQYSAPAGSRVETKDKIQAVPQLYYTFSPANIPVAFGLGVYAPYGLGLEWPENSGFRSLATKGRITYLTLNPVFAWKAHSTFSIAAGPTFNLADAELRRGIIAPGDQFKFTGDGTDVGFNAGLQWRPHEQHSIGLSYRGSTTVDLRGKTDTRSTVFFIPSGSETASARFRFPQHLIAGWSYRPTPAWNFEFNADWTDWDHLDTVTIKQASGDLSQPFNWRSSLFYEWGATRFFSHGWRASAGYIYSENSVPDGSFNPIVPDSDRHIFSAGIGGQHKSFNWDAAYQFAYGPPRNVLGSPPSAFTGESADGRYRFTSHAFTISLQYQF